MDALELLQMHSELQHKLQVMAYLDAWGKETIVRNYGDLTANHIVRKIDMEMDDEQNY